MMAATCTIASGARVATLDFTPSASVRSPQSVSKETSRGQLCLHLVVVLAVHVERGHVVALAYQRLDRLCADVSERPRQQHVCGFAHRASPSSSSAYVGRNAATSAASVRTSVSARTPSIAGTSAKSPMTLRVAYASAPSPAARTSGRGPCEGQRRADDQQRGGGDLGGHM